MGQFLNWKIFWHLVVVSKHYNPSSFISAKYMNEVLWIVMNNELLQLALIANSLALSTYLITECHVRLQFFKNNKHFWVPVLVSHMFEIHQHNTAIETIFGMRNRWVSISWVAENEQLLEVVSQKIRYSSQKVINMIKQEIFQVMTVWFPLCHMPGSLANHNVVLKSSWQPHCLGIG